MEGDYQEAEAVVGGDRGLRMVGLDCGAVSGGDCSWDAQFFVSMGDGGL